jgi:hypothetical protein
MSGENHCGKPNREQRDTVARQFAAGLSGETTGLAERSDQVFHLTVGARSPDIVLASL